MRIPYEQPRQGAGGALCSVLLLSAIGFSALQLVEPATVPSSRTASVPVPSLALVREAKLAPHPAVSAFSPLPDVVFVHSPKRSIRPVQTTRVAVASMTAAPRIVRRHSFHPAVVEKRLGKRRQLLRRPTQAPTAILLAVRLKDVAPASPVLVASATDLPAPPQADIPVDVDLPQMRSYLLALHAQLKVQKGQFEELQALPLSSLPDKEFAKKIRAQIKADFGPQFQKQLLAQQQQLRIDLDAELPQIRVQAEQAAREAADAQMQVGQVQDLAAQARAEALKQLPQKLPCLKKQIKQQLQSLPAPPIAQDGPAF